MIDLVLAVPDIDNEPQLVAAASLAGLRVVRRAVDAADLLACAAADPRIAIVVSAGVPRLSTDLLGRVLADDRAVVGLAADDRQVERLAVLGLRTVVRTQADALATMQALAARLDIGPGEAGFDSPAGPTDHAPTVDQAGRLVAVWGPPGAPGRTTTAIGLAMALARSGQRVCLVDADTHAPSIVPALGILDELSGVSVACRQAENGMLAPGSLRACCREVAGAVAVLGGIPHAGRWADLREPALEALWRGAGAAFERVVVDVGATIESDATVAHGSGSPLLATRRNAAATTVLGVAEVVLVVARASTMGVARLLSSIGELDDVAPQAERVLALTADAAGQAREAERALRAAGLAMAVVPLVRDRMRLERALRAGQDPYQTATRRERRALDALAAAVDAPR